MIKLFRAPLAGVLMLATATNVSLPARAAEAQGAQALSEGHSSMIRLAQRGPGGRHRGPGIVARPNIPRTPRPSFRTGPGPGPRVGPRTGPGPGRVFRPRPSFRDRGTSVRRMPRIAPRGTGPGIARRRSGPFVGPGIGPRAVPRRRIIRPGPFVGPGRRIAPPRRAVRRYRRWRPGYRWRWLIAPSIYVASELDWCHYHAYRVRGMHFHRNIRCHRHRHWDHPAIRYVYYWY